MSHESNPQPAINTEHPYLMPRNSGAIDVAHVKVDERGNPVFDEEGWVTLVSQDAGAEKQAHPKALSDEVQGHFATELGESRLSNSHEQLQRYGHLDSELAGIALAATEAEQLDEAEEQEAVETNEPSAMDELLAENSWKQVGDLTQQLKTRTNMIMSQLDEFDSLLSRINYEGGRTETSANQLVQSLDSLRQVIHSSDADTELADRARSIRNNAQEIIDSVRRNETVSDEERMKARKTEDIVEEMNATARIVSGQYDDLRTFVRQYGKFETNIEELNRTTQGYEFTIALLKSELSNASDDMLNARGRLVRLEADLEDVDRLRRM